MQTDDISALTRVTLVVAMSSTWRRLFVHLVWGTRGRLAVINADREAMIGRIFSARTTNARSELIAFGCSDDHVHALISLHVSASVAGLVRQLKSGTSQAIEKHALSDTPFRWQRGYAVLSVDHRDAPNVAAYVRAQRERHRTGGLVPEWEPPLDALESESQVADADDSE